MLCLKGIRPSLWAEPACDACEKQPASVELVGPSGRGYGSVLLCCSGDLLVTKIGSLPAPRLQR